MIEWPVLFLTGLVAGWVDSIAGGGGLITVPVLMNLGLPPAVALGTNKLQGSFGSGSATWHYAQAGLIDFRETITGILFTAIGAATGACAVQQMRPDFLRIVVPILLIAIALYLLLRPQLGEAESKPRLAAGIFYLLFGLGIGFYDGFFGPGTGSFWAMAYVLVLGFHLTRATAHTKLMNFTSNVVALVAFAISGQVDVMAGTVMGAGQLIGARLGARMVIRRGVKFIRPIFITVVLAITARLLWAR